MRKKEIEKPKVLYHASENNNLEELVPRQESVRDPNEGPVVFATPVLAFVTCFLVDTNDSWTLKGRMNGVYYTVISDEKRFREDDKGGTIYTLSSEHFYYDPKKGMKAREWVSKSSVKPIGKTRYSSGLEAMIQNGVQVYFVDKRTFREIKNSKDHGFSILKKLKSENQKRGINIKVLPEDS